MNKTKQLKKPWVPGESGNPRGRPLGSRNKLSEKFILALHDDFEEHGSAVIQQVRQERTTLDDPRVQHARGSPLGRRLERFFKAPVWSVEGPDGAPRVRAYDLRFQSIVLDSSPVFSFTLPGDGATEADGAAR